MSPAKASPRCRPGPSPSLSASPSPSPRLQLQLQARLYSGNDDNVQRSNEPERFYAPRAFFTFEVAAAKREEGEGEEERGKERERLALLCFDTRLQSI